MKKHLRRLLSGLAAIIPGLFLVAVLSTETRTFLRAQLLPDFRQATSSVVGNIFGDGTPGRVVKIKTRDGLFLEVYKSGEYGKETMISKIQLDQTRDGYFTFNGQPTRLALEDIDGDSRVEILAPAFDQNLTARLNIYRYNPITHIFERIVNPL